MMKFLVFSFCLFLALPSWAQGFFTSLPDVPLMAGLTELEERALSFDKPEGRILIAVAQMNDSIIDSQVQSFYEQALPQFGWKALDEFSYVRGVEKLKIVIQDEGQEKFLEITISP